MTNKDKPKRYELSEKKRDRIFNVEPDNKPSPKFGPMLPQKSVATLPPKAFETEAEIVKKVEEQKKQIREIFMVDSIHYDTISREVLKEKADLIEKNPDEGKRKEVIMERLARFLLSFKYGTITAAFNMRIIDVMFSSFNEYEGFGNYDVSNVLRDANLNQHFINDREFENFCIGLAFWRCRMHYFGINPAEMKKATFKALEFIKNERLRTIEPS